MKTKIIDREGGVLPGDGGRTVDVTTDAGNTYRVYVSRQGVARYVLPHNGGFSEGNLGANWPLRDSEAPYRNRDMLALRKQTWPAIVEAVVQAHD